MNEYVLRKKNNEKYEFIKNFKTTRMNARTNDIL